MLRNKSVSLCVMFLVATVLQIPLWSLQPMLAKAQPTEPDPGKVSICAVNRAGEPIVGREWSALASDQDVYFGITDTPEGCHKGVPIPAGPAEFEMGTGINQDVTIFSNTWITLTFNIEPYQTYMPALEAN